MKNMMHGKTLKIEEGEHKGGERGGGGIKFPVCFSQSNASCAH